MWILKFTLEKHIFWKFPNMFLVSNHLHLHLLYGPRAIFITSNKDCQLFFTSLTLFFPLFSSSSDPSRIPSEAREIVAVRDYWHHMGHSLWQKYQVIFFYMAPLLEIIADRASPPMLSIAWLFNGNSQESLDEVVYYCNRVNPLESLKILYSFPFRALQQSNRHNQIELVDSSLFLIG